MTASELAQLVAQFIGWASTAGGMTAILVFTLLGKMSRKLGDILLTIIILGLIVLLLNGGNPLDFINELLKSFQSAQPIAQ